jgi:hypothetical protein
LGLPSDPANATEAVEISKQSYLKIRGIEMKLTRVIFATLGFILALTVVSVAPADPIDFSGSGTWDANAPTTAYSQAGATWQFSFFLPDPIASNPTTQVTDFSYTLDGNLVTTSLPGGVLFYSVADGGGFDLYPTIDNSSGVSVISLLFPEDVGTYLSPVLGSYSATIELNDGLTPGEGSGTVNITPEPPSIILLGTALMLSGGLIYHRRFVSPARETR